MAMMTGDRSVAISVTSAGRSTSHQTNCTVKVPYSSMARTIQLITKQGGKITNVTVGTTASSPAPTVAPSDASSDISSAAPTATIEPIKESNKGFKSKKK
jgi:hypothetical protein